MDHRLYKEQQTQYQRGDDCYPGYRAQNRKPDVMMRWIH